MFYWHMKLRRILLKIWFFLNFLWHLVAVIILPNLLVKSCSGFQLKWHSDDLLYIYSMTLIYIIINMIFIQIINSY